MAAPRKYSEELKERTTRLALDARRDPASKVGAIKRIADQLGIHPEAAGERDLEDRFGFFRGGGARPQAEVEVPTAVLVEYIDEHRDRFGVEPICQVLRDAGLQVAPSTYYAARTRPPSARPRRSRSARVRT